jgi:hypothetical protein
MESIPPTAQKARDDGDSRPGVLGGIRTHNIQLRRLALYPLSYEDMYIHYATNRVYLMLF